MNTLLESKPIDLKSGQHRLAELPGMRFPEVRERLRTRMGITTVEELISAVSLHKDQGEGLRKTVHAKKQDWLQLVQMARKSLSSSAIRSLEKMKGPPMHLLNIFPFSDSAELRIEKRAASLHHETTNPVHKKSIAKTTAK